MKNILNFFFFLGIAYSQGQFNGVSKDTRACSSGVVASTYDFMIKYFPVQESDDDCTDGQCDCGTQARVELTTRYRNETTVDRRREDVNGFGLHCVYAAGEGGVREDQIGSFSQEQLEKIFSDKFADMSKYDVFMEYTTGLYTVDISHFTRALDADNVEYLSFIWTTTEGEFVSVLVHPPNTQIVHEVVAPSSTAPKHVLAKAKKHGGERFSFKYLGGHVGPPEVGAPEVGIYSMSALYVSRASTDIARDKAYFQSVFGLSESHFITSAGTDPNGNSYQMLEVQMSITATTKYRLIQPANVNDGIYSVTWWENYQNEVNQQYMTSPICGWPLTGDNHNGFDWISGFDQEDIMSNMEQMNMPYFCRAAPMGGTHCYVTTPYGYQIQLDGNYSNPPTYYSYTGGLCATYKEHCLNLDIIIVVRLLSVVVGSGVLLKYVFQR